MKQIDFSQHAIKTEVNNRILQHPISIYAILIGCVGVFFWLIDLIGRPLLYAALGAIGFAVASYLVNYLRKGTIETGYLARLNARMQKQKQTVIAKLKQRLAHFRKVEGLARYSRQAEAQFSKVREKFERFQDILSEKLDSREVTYGRFLGTVEQLYLSVLDNLEDATLALETMHSIDMKYIEYRLRELNQLETLEQADKDEVATLEERLRLRETQREKVNKLLTVNEQAMTQIDSSMSGIANTKTRAGRASMDAEFAREELVKLIERTKRYSEGE